MGTWQALRNQPAFCASTMLLLTDGTVMCQQENGRQWWRLRPDRFGSYVDGTWSSLAPMMEPRLYYGSAVLADGRVMVIGGEYHGGTAQAEQNTGEMYDPLTNSWSDLATPGWNEVGDPAFCVLQDGRVIMGKLDTSQTAIFTPGPDSWQAGPNKPGGSSEESWALLADDTVLTVRTDSSRNAQKYLPDTNTWVSAGQTVDVIVEVESSEIGPAALLPDGRCFFVGATGKTALYTAPANPADAGTWEAGPDFPTSNNMPQGTKDGPGAVLPNGNFLCAVAPIDHVQGNYLSPTQFFEFDPSTMTLMRVPDPPNNGNPPFNGRMLVIPSGQVLFCSDGPEMYAYTPDGEPRDEWRPQIVRCPEQVVAGST